MSKPQNMNRWQLGPLSHYFLARDFVKISKMCILYIYFFYFQSKLSVTYILVCNVIALVIFSFLSSIMGDAVKSKPWVGFSGLFSVCLATLGKNLN